MPRAWNGLEHLALTLAAPLLIFPTVRPRWTVAALAALTMVWLVRWLVRGEPWPVTPFNGALLLFVLMIPVAVWASAIPELTVPKATGLVLGLAVFRAVAFAVHDRRTLLLALAAFSLVGLGITAVGVLGAGWLDKVAPLAAATGRIPRLVSDLPGAPARGVHPNQLAGALLLYLPVSIAVLAQWLLGHARGRGAKLLHIASLPLAAVFGGVLLLSQSRSGWVGGVAALVALASLWGITDPRRWARVLGAMVPALLVLVAVAGVVYIGPESVGETLYQTGSGAPVEGVVGDMTLAGRVEIWSRALYAMQDFPFTGCGLGAFRQVVHALYPLFLLGPNYDIAHAHNIFLQTGLDLGFPGLIAYLALLMVALAVCWRLAVHRRDSLVRPLALGLGAGLIGLHVYGLTDALALGSKPAVAFWFALGLIAALERVPAQDLVLARTADEGTTLLDPLRRHRWLVGLGLVAGLLITAGGVYWATRSTGPATPAQPSIRLPLYPAAQGTDVRQEGAPADAGWAGPLEVATFTTTHPITDVVQFYTGALAAEGWHTSTEAGDNESWGGIYTRDGGHAVCMLNVFSIEGEAWTSIVCGDKTELVDLPPLSPLPMPTASHPAD